MAPFRCESCGYILAGIDPRLPCPECGTPIDRSLPESHPGSPWQQKPSVSSWVRTLAQITFRPRSAFRSLRMDPARWRAVFWLNMTLASALFAFPALVAFSFGPRNVHFVTGLAHQVILDGTGFWSIALAILTIAILPLVLPLAARMSRAVRVARMSRLAVNVANAHVTFVWVLASILWLIGCALRRALVPAEPVESPTSVQQTAILLASAIPMLLFITSVVVLGRVDHVGTRVCRYFNDPAAPRPTAAASSPTTGPSPAPPPPP